MRIQSRFVALPKAGGRDTIAGGGVLIEQVLTLSNQGPTIFSMAAVALDRLVSLKFGGFVKPIILITFIISALGSAQVPSNLSATDCLTRGNAIEIKIDDLASIRQALQFFDRAIALDPKLARAYMRAGGIRMALALHYKSRRHLRKAILLFRRCTEIEPKNGLCYAVLGDAYGYSGDIKRAQKNRERACGLGVEGSCKEIRSIQDGRPNPSMEQFYEDINSHRDPKEIADIP